MRHGSRFGICMLALVPLLLAAASAQGEPSGEYGAVELGASVERVIAAVRQGPDADPVVYHTYVVEVPASVPSVTVAVEGFGSDLDLAVKVGAPILDYTDVDVFDVEETPSPRATLDTPGGGPLYVDVMNLLPAEARYRLTVTAAGADVAPGGEAGDVEVDDDPLAAEANPLAVSADPFVGTFEGDGLHARFESSGDGYAGAFTLGGRRYTLDATASEGRLRGRFHSEGSAFDFSARFDGDTLVVESGGATYRLQPLDAPTNPLTDDVDAGDEAGAPAPQARGPVLAQGPHGTLREDDALAFIEALEFSLQQVGYVGRFTETERAQMLQAIAQSYPTLAPDEQAVLAQARQVWSNVQQNWPRASSAEREQFVMGVFVLAFGEQSMQQAAAEGGGGGGGGNCHDIDACVSRYTDPETLSDTMNAQSCWAAAGCSGYDPVQNDFTYDSYGDGY